ncbi:hypothetical protein [Granulicella tundricola]|uniref:hypothetical protein n=1 Tax=Granulicella tundricola TaxID=940615 RepID=UPI0012F92EF2|nr:hypothetical protein [Granulicella tundricola]
MDETQEALLKLIEVTERLSREVADLVDDLAERVSRTAVGEVRAKAREIRESGQELRRVSDTLQIAKLKSGTEFQSKPSK